MLRVKRLAAMKNAERALLLRALFIVGMTRVALWILRVDASQRIASHAAAVGGGPVPLDRIAWAVRTVSRYVPGATCLTQALAVQALLESGGHKSRVEIGVVREAGKFEAHAWVTCGGQIVIGGPEVARYVRLDHLDQGGRS